MNNIISELHKCVQESRIDESIILKLIKGREQENEVLDFKKLVPESDSDYATTIYDAVSFYNSYGGFLVFGVEELNKDREFKIIGIQANFQVDKFRDKSQSYLSSEIRFKIIDLVIEGKKIEVLCISKRGPGERPVYFKKNGPQKNGSNPIFKKNGLAFRRIGANASALTADDYEFLYSERIPSGILTDTSLISYERHLDNNIPDRSLICPRFVGRSDDIKHLWQWLGDRYSRAMLIAGEGGLGKTSLAYNFAEKISSSRVDPFEQVIWLTAKKRQFVAIDDSYRDSLIVDFYDIKSLFFSIAEKHGCIRQDYEDLDLPELKELVRKCCNEIPSFIVIDDVDSLTQEDQKRVMEMALILPDKTKVLLTARNNFSFSPEHLLRLRGFCDKDYSDYVDFLRVRYELSSSVMKGSRITQLQKLTGGSPLFTDSLFRLEKRGLSLDQAIEKWKGDKGIEVRKAALAREIDQLGKEAKRVIYVISQVKSTSLVELRLILGYTETTLQDALNELIGLFLVNDPPIGDNIRYTIESNTASLVIDMAKDLSIDHSALDASIRRSRNDAIGRSQQRANNIVGQAINQANAYSRNGDNISALKTIEAASSRLKNPHKDLLLASGRFLLKIEQPDFSRASSFFLESYNLGQRKRLLFDLWYESEVSKGDYRGAYNVAKKAIDNNSGGLGHWYEKRGRASLSLAASHDIRSSRDSSIRDLSLAKSDLFQASKIFGRQSVKGQELDRLLADIDKIVDLLESGGNIKS